jgi:hypothetical protein
MMLIYLIKDHNLLAPRQAFNLEACVAAVLDPISLHLGSSASIAIQPLPDVIRPRRAAKVAFKLLPPDLLKMCRLREQEKLV